MKNCKIISAAALSLFVAGCATSSGVLPIGRDSFTLTVQSSTAAAAKQDAITEANAYCAKKSESIEVLRMRPDSDAYGWHSYEINFKCVK